VKILFTAMMDLSVHGGFTGLLDYQANLLRHAGHDVTVVGMTTQQPVIAGPTVTVTGSGPAAQLKTAWACVAYAARYKPDVAVVTQAGAPLVAPLAAILRSMGIGVVYDCMDPAIEVLQNNLGPGLAFHALRPWLAASYPIIDRSSAAALSVSPGLDAILRRQRWRGPILRFYNIHGTRFVGVPGRSGIREGEWASATILVYAGGLQPGFRGIEDQLRGVALARRAGCDIRFLMVGYGDPRPFLHLAQSLHVGDVVKVLPHQPPDRLADILADCDVAVSNSTPFALPSKIFEYLNNGVRLVSIDDGNDVNALCGDFVIRYDGSLTGMVQALIAHAYRPRDESSLTQARSFVARLREESTASLFAAVTMATADTKRPSGEKQLTPQLEIQQRPDK
jgi:glycosyltransferase involved in cell wall biosynthesis